MNKITLSSFVVTLIASASFSLSAEIPELPKPEKEHQWLRQLTGEWESEVEMFMQPGQPPVKSQGTETVRSIGGFWIIGENKGDFMGTPYTGIITLGYDTPTQQYVGTWVDSMSGYLWRYEGTVDDSSKVLTLETEGPCPHRPGELSQFREVIEVKSNDHYTFTSLIQDEEGKWNVGLRINYRRAK